MSDYCESCLEAAREEGGEGIEDTVLGEFGADIMDHLCDAIETEGDVTCACTAHKERE